MKIAGLISNETDVSKKLRLEMESFDAHVEQIECHTSSPGIPDIDGCYNGFQFKIEIKFINTKKKKAEIRSTQKRWFRDRIDAGYSPTALLYHENSKGKVTWVLLRGEDFVTLPNASVLDDWTRCGNLCWICYDTLDVYELLRLVTSGG